MNSAIAVLGAGAWGTAIAKVIADKGKAVSRCRLRLDADFSPRAPLPPQ
jgi:glycerol-3-phosphate dehydrogenase